LKIGISNACDEKVGKALTHNSGRDYMARGVMAPKPVRGLIFHLSFDICHLPLPEPIFLNGK
jgi:hypothetical protein